MRKVAASTLRVGDVFCRQTYGPPDPVMDWRYTVKSIHRVPLRGYFGELHERVQIEADSHLTGPQSMHLGTEEEVWLLD